MNTEFNKEKFIADIITASQMMLDASKLVTQYNFAFGMSILGDAKILLDMSNVEQGIQGDCGCNDGSCKPSIAEISEEVKNNIDAIAEELERELGDL